MDVPYSITSCLCSSIFGGKLAWLNICLVGLTCVNCLCRYCMYSCESQMTVVYFQPCVQGCPGNMSSSLLLSCWKIGTISFQKGSSMGFCSTVILSCIVSSLVFNYDCNDQFWPDSQLQKSDSQILAALLRAPLRRLH